MNHTQRVERAIEALAADQFGAFGRNQALDLGASRRMIDYRVSSGAWPKVLAGVHRVAVVASSPPQLAMAACLWSAPDGLVSHQTAAQLWRFEDVKSDRVHITLPSTRNLRSKLVTVHRVRDLIAADVGRWGPIAVTSALRTVIDLAAVLDIDALEVAIESALRRRLFSVGQLRWRSDGLLGTGRPGSAALRSLLAKRDLGRTDSGWEVRTAQLLEAAGFGAPVRQHVVRDERGKEIARVDLAYPQAKLAIEYDSDEWHSGTTRRHRDAARRNRLRALGWTVLEITPATLRSPDQLIAMVELVLAA